MSAERRCPSCSATVPAGFAFCGACGARLGADDTPEQRAPVVVAEEAGDRRVVTAIFADLSGFTNLAEQLDPEDLTALVNECFGALMEEVRLREGGLEKQIGDAIVAVFGAPLAHEDDPVRAVQAGLAMHERMREINHRVEPQLGRSLQLHIGINTGLVVMGRGIALETGGGVADMEVLGDTMNVAARLQQVAREGQLIVGETTYAATKWAFDYRKLPPLALKGKRERITAYECLGPKRRPGSARGFTSGIGSELCGRDAELSAFVGAVERVASGEGTVVAVLGEAGLGKSRLAAEARASSSAADVRWLEGRSLSFGQTISYFPFVEILKTDAEIGEDVPEQEAWRKLEHRVRSLFADEANEVLPYLAVLLALDVPGELAERVKYLDGEAMRHQIFRASLRHFERLARERPTVLVFEDLHWADQSSEALVEHLTPLVRSVPLLICCLTRPDPDTPGGRFVAHVKEEHADRHTEIRLSQLSENDSVRLIRNLLRIEPTPKLLRLFEKTEGNPFYVEELVRSLIDLGAVERDDATGRWQLVANIDEIAIPDTIQGLIMARVDRLDDEAKQLLRTASVIGRTFFYQVLRSLGDEQNGRLDRRLSDLEQLELIRKKGLSAELEYIFKHALTQEAVYGSILLRRRRELHGRVARSIEELFADRLDEFFPLLAHHYAQAEEWDRAQEYLMKAGDRAGTLAADAEALTHYQQALAAYARAFGEKWDPLQRAELDRKIGEALFRRGQNELAREHLYNALSHLGADYPATAGKVRLAAGRELARQVDHLLLPRVFIRRGETDPIADELARIYDMLGWIDFFVDQDRLVLDALLVQNMAERGGSLRGMVTGTIGLGFVFDHVPIFRVAARYHRRSVELAEELADPRALGLAHFAFGFHHLRVGRPDETERHYQRSTEVYQQVGDLRGWAACACDLTRIWRGRGRLADAVARNREIARLGIEAGDAQAAAWGMHHAAMILWRIGALEAAARELTSAIQLFNAVPDPLGTAEATGDLGHTLTRQGKPREAIDRLEAVLREMRERRLRSPQLTIPINALAEAYVVAAEAAEGDERSELVKQAGRACKAALKQANLDALALPAALRNQGRLEWVRGRERQAAKCWRASEKAAERLGFAYELATTRLESGRLTGDREQIVRAEQQLAEMREGVEVPAATGD